MLYVEKHSAVYLVFACDWIFKSTQVVLLYRGEIKNLSTDTTLQFVKVTAHLSDESGQPVAVTTCCYADPNDIEQGHTSTFDSFVQKDEISGTPTSYRLSFDWSGNTWEKPVEGCVRRGSVHRYIDFQITCVSEYTIVSMEEGKRRRGLEVIMQMDGWIGILPSLPFLDIQCPIFIGHYWFYSFQIMYFRY